MRKSSSYATYDLDSPDLLPTLPTYQIYLLIYFAFKSQRHQCLHQFEPKINALSADAMKQLVVSQYLVDKAVEPSMKMGHIIAYGGYCLAIQPLGLLKLLSR